MPEQPFTAALTPEQVEQGERISQEAGVVRRMGLMMLTRDYDQMREDVLDDAMAEAMLDLAEALNTHNKRHSEEAELLKAAEARLWYVLTEQMEEIENAADQP
jgi:hypothetical protein